MHQSSTSKNTTFPFPFPFSQFQVVYWNENGVLRGLKVMKQEKVGV